jgi:phenylpropionate dioxygenase-like ring-hydroxylating dioxygenase large terminal subunit
MITQTDLAQRVGPILTDGTPVRDLVDFDKHEISMRVNHDPELHRLELARVFARSWIALGHESDIPNHGDFMQRYHGEDRIIITRASDGKVHALLNVCAHRGMEVCWADDGNQTQFKCPYHGWVFDNSGSLLGAPFEQEMYGDWDKSQYGLREGRVELRHGFVFVNFDENAVSLEEWLGDMAFYYDHNFAGVEWEPVGGQAFRWKFNGNWKTISDQNAGDMYHVAGAHRAIAEIGFMPPGMLDSQIDCVKIEFSGHGHNAFSLNPMGRPSNDDDLVANPLGDVDVKTGDAKYAFDDRSWVLFLFPTNQTSGGKMMSGSDGKEYRTANLATYMPSGTGAMEYRPMSYVEKGTPEDVRAMIRKQTPIMTTMLGDDADLVRSITQNARGAVAQQETMKYNAWRGEHKPDGWPGPGTVYAGYSRDETNWDFWSKWFNMLTDEEA